MHTGAGRQRVGRRKSITSGGALRQALLGVATPLRGGLGLMLLDVWADGKGVQVDDPLGCLHVLLGLVGERSRKGAAKKHIKTI